MSSRAPSWITRAGGQRYMQLCCAMSSGPHTLSGLTSSTRISSCLPACCRARRPRPARRDGARSGCRERPGVTGGPRGHATHRAQGALRDRRLGLAARQARHCGVRCGGEDDRDRLRRRPARFTPIDSEKAREAVGWHPEGTGFVCVGSLSERKNVLGLARAFARRGEGSLAFVGEGALRGTLQGAPGIHLAGRVPHDVVPRGSRRQMSSASRASSSRSGCRRSRAWRRPDRSLRPGSAGHPSSFLPRQAC